MTLGEKIRKYRQLKKMTQKELGMKIGFSASTAASRIRKYESDQMAPKMNLRAKLADALDVDMSALSDINIRSYEDVMHTLFFFEESFGMEINRSGDSIHLTFDYKDGVNENLMTYLYSWYSQKKTTFNDEAEQAAARKNYELWKSRFPKDLDALWKSLRDKINSCYDPLIEDLESTTPKIENLSEFVEHLQDLIEADCRISFGTQIFEIGVPALTITFYTALLTDPPANAANALAQFFYDLRTLKGYGLPVYDNHYIRPDGIQVSYILRLPLLASTSELLNKIESFHSLKERGIYTEGEIEFMQSEFNRSIANLKYENLQEYIEFQYPPEE